MAFFKFRFPGQSAASADAAPAESLETVRQRARFRLLGAVVLVLVAVVVFPLLFDSQPRPVAVDTPVLIPDQASTPVLTPQAVVPAAQAPARPLLPASDAAVTVAGSLEPGKEEVVAPAASAPAPAKPAPVASADAPVKAQDKPHEAASAKPAARTETKPKAEPKADKPTPQPDNTVRSEDGQRAKALLEGATAKSAKSRSAVQVGAFTEADKVREVRRKLQQAGFQTYVQVIEKDGKKTTRVRVGPFDTRAEAEKAAARIRKLNLPASVMGL